MSSSSATSSATSSAAAVAATSGSAGSSEQKFVNATLQSAIVHVNPNKCSSASITTSSNGVYDWAKEETETPGTYKLVPKKLSVEYPKLAEAVQDSVSCPTRYLIADGKCQIPYGTIGTVGGCLMMIGEGSRPNNVKAIDEIPLASEIDIVVSSGTVLKMVLDDTITPSPFFLDAKQHFNMMGDKQCATFVLPKGTALSTVVAVSHNVDGMEQVPGAVMTYLVSSPCEFKVCSARVVTFKSVALKTCDCAKSVWNDSSSIVDNKINISVVNSLPDRYSDEFMKLTSAQANQKLYVSRGFRGTLYNPNVSRSTYGDDYVVDRVGGYNCVTVHPNTIIRFSCFHGFSRTMVIGNSSLKPGDVMEACDKIFMEFPRETVVTPTKGGRGDHFTKEEYLAIIPGEPRSKILLPAGLPLCIPGKLQCTLFKEVVIYCSVLDGVIVCNDVF